MNREQRRVLLGGVLATATVIGATFLNGGQHSAHAGVLPLTTLTSADQLDMVGRAENFTSTMSSAFRSLSGVRRRPRFAFAFVSRDGHLLNTTAMDDAWVGAQDLATGKARAAAFFSSNENAITSRVVGQLSQAHDPKTGEGPAGPFWGIWSSNQPSGQFGAAIRNGIVTEAGGVPLYKHGVLVGALGVAGDSVDLDEAVAFQAELNFLPPLNVAVAGFPN
jgi:uncharacterized protein GlcG (DUF336 family)